MMKSNSKSLKKLIDQPSLLEVALEIEKFLDFMNLYVYPNWFKGIVYSGPHLSRYWVDLVLRYDYENMPDPAGAKVLAKLGVKCFYKKTNISEPRKVEEPDDLRPGSRKPKIDDQEIWLVTLRIPRRFIDEDHLDDLEVIDDEVDIDDISDASDAGIDQDDFVMGGQDAE